MQNLSESAGQPLIDLLTDAMIRHQVQTLPDLARSFGVPVQELVTMTYPEANPTLATVFRVSEALNVTPDALVALLRVVTPLPSDQITVHPGLQTAYQAQVQPFATVNEFAEQAGLPLGALLSILQGELDWFEVSRVKQVAAALGLSLQQLLQSVEGSPNGPQVVTG